MTGVTTLLPHQGTHADGGSDALAAILALTPLPLITQTSIVKTTGSFSTNSAAYVPFTNMTMSFTTTASNPVLIMFSATAEISASSTACVDLTINETSVDNGGQGITSVYWTANIIMPISFVYLKTLAAGTYRIGLVAKTSAGTVYFRNGNTSLVVMELKK